MNPYLVAALVAVLVLASSALGSWLRQRLPQHHLDEDSREMIKVGVAFLSTLAALVLGLLISSAKDSFDTITKRVESTAAEVLQMDDSLRELGAAGQPSRERLRQIVARTREDLWGGDGGAQWSSSTSSGIGEVAALQRSLRALTPADATGVVARARALQLSEQLAQVYAAAIAHRGSSISFPLLAILVCWLMIIATGLNLLAPPHGTLKAINLVCALSLASAIFLMLEMDQPYGGLICVSDGPLRSALAQVGR